MVLRCCYVRLDDGTVLVQVPNPNSRWGFYLCDEENSWDGGFGVGTNQGFVALEDKDVSEADRQRLGWIIDAYRDK